MTIEWGKVLWAIFRLRGGAIGAVYAVREK